MSVDRFIPALESLKQIQRYQGQTVSQLPIEQLGTTYVMAQSSCWLSADQFLVGRWDGSLSIFDKTQSTTVGAEITVASSVPADQGVQMVAWVATNTFVTSNDEKSIAVWKSPDSTFELVAVSETLNYDSKYGVANCAACASVGTDLYMVSGHESGFLLLWKGAADGSEFSWIGTVDLTSTSPTNPWGLQNIRGVQLTFGDDGQLYAVTGSENGLICVVRVSDGAVVSKTIFNPEAQRGINSISLYGNGLIVGNCSVGTSDKNFWFYMIDQSDWSVRFHDSVNLIVDTSRAQVFDFCVTWGWLNGSLVWYAATEEGVLWMGDVDSNGKITTQGYQEVAVADLGAAIAATLSDLSYVAYNVSSFNTSPSGAGKMQGNPNFPNPNHRLAVGMRQSGGGCMRIRG